MGLSPIDLKLLRFAMQHGVHFSNEEIGRKLRIAPSTVNYSIRKLVNSKVIHGFRYKLDYRKIGLNGMGWVLFPTNKGEEGQRKLIKELLAYPQVHVAAFITGDRDIAIKVIDKDVLALSDFILNISKRFAGEMPLVLFSTQQFKAHNVCVEPKPKPLELDSIDLALLDKKMVHPELTLAEISNKLSIHKNTTSRRWRKLKRHGVVLKESLLLDPAYYPDVGIALKALVLFNVEPTYRDKFISMMCSMPEIHELHALLSSNDFLAIVRTAGVSEFYEVIRKICENHEKLVQKTVSYIFLRIRSHPPNYLQELKKQGTISF